MESFNMLIKKEKVKFKRNSKSCSVWEYELPSRSLGFAVAKITGRYPESGASLNKKCDEIYYVMKGKGKIYYDGRLYKIKKGDAFLIKRGKKYWVEGKNLILALPTSPAWYPEQYKNVKI